MGKIHGKNTVVFVNGVELTQYGTNIEFKQSADSHDTTTFGNDAHRKSGGLKDGGATIQGFYDNTASTGPRPVIEPLIGTITVVIERPEGTGVGRPTRLMNALVVDYTETSPVADMVTWQCEVEFDGIILAATQ